MHFSLIEIHLCDKLKCQIINQFKRCNFYFLINQDTHMQRKNTAPSEPSFVEMHFAVVPYEVQYSVPNDQIYSLYFQKGLQILGQTQYPIENHQKLKKIELPIQQNVIYFRLFSDKNAEYQWSIYKRVSEMQEFLETKKINLKDILKKQPQKKPQIPKPALQKKQTSAKSEVKRSELRNNTIKVSGVGNNEFASVVQQNLVQKLTDASNQGKGLVYNESIVSEVGKFTLKFYLFKASSSQELSKTIEDKAKQRQQAKATYHENSGIKLAEITESDPHKETQSNKNIIQVSEQTPVEDEILLNESAKKTYTEEIKEITPEQGGETFTQEPIQVFEEPPQKKVIEKPQSVKYPVVQETSEPFSDTVFAQEQIQETQAFANGETPVQAVIQKPIEEPARGISGLKRTDSVIIEEEIKEQKVTLGSKKRRSPNVCIWVAAIIIIIWLLSYLNIFDVKEYMPEGFTSAFNTTSSIKKGKKERFTNRKKASI